MGGLMFFLTVSRLASYLDREVDERYPSTAQFTNTIASAKLAQRAALQVARMLFSHVCPTVPSFRWAAGVKTCDHAL